MEGMGARVSDRIGAIAESATLAVDAKAKALKAAGRPVIGFGAGEPDFPTPGYIVEAAVAAACATRATTGTRPVAGLPELRAAVAAKTARDSGYQVDPTRVLITNGGKQAVYNTFAALLDPGDEVLLIAPVLDHLPRGDQARRRGASRGGHRRDDGLSGPCRATGGGAHRPRPRCCFSSRPRTRPARSTRPRRSTAIGRWAAEHRLWVVTDEIYEHLVYGDAEHASIAAAAPELGDRWSLLNGVAKTYAMTGWRVGWLIGPADVVKAAINLQSHATSNVSNIAQVGCARGGERRPVRGGRDARGVRPAAAPSSRCVSDIPGIVCPEPQGAFYAYPSVKGLLGRPLHGRVGRPAPRRWPTSSSTRSRWRSFRARRSARPATCACLMRSATTT